MLVLMGKACSGKDTICNGLVKDYGFKRVITYTTRPIGEGEVDGINYHYISNEEFDQKEEKGFFIETKSYKTAMGDWKYGTAMEDIRHADDKSVIILSQYEYLEMLYNINVHHGLFGIKKPIIYSCYIYANMDTIRERLKSRGRGETEEEINRRIRADSADFIHTESLADFTVNNSGTISLDRIVKMIAMSYGVLSYTGTKQYYICNRSDPKCCDNCRDICNYTSNIEYAKNFEKDKYGNYFETENWDNQVMEDCK